MSSDALAKAIAKAARTGPVSVAVGVATGGVVQVSGGVINTYWRVGAAPDDGDSTIVVRAGALAVVFTGATKVIPG